MESETRRYSRWALVLPVIVTVLVGAGLGGYVVLEDQRKAERIEAADDIGADYLSEVATFRTRIAKALKAADQSNPASLRAALKKATATPPVLPDAEGAAATESTTYSEAQNVEAELLTPYRELAVELKKADEAQAFIKAAKKVLKMRATDYVDGTLLRTSTQVRGSLIPAFVAARDEFAKVKVPKGAEKAAELTRAAVQEVIDGATRLADSIDANRSYTFTYGESYQAAATAVDDFGAQINGDFTEALNAIKDLR